MKASKIAAATAAVLGLGLASVPKADAAYIAYLYQDGANVVATGSGSLDVTGLSFYHDESDPPAIFPAIGALLLGSGGNISVFEGLTGPSVFGTGNLAYATSGTGNMVAVSGGFFLGVPVGYVSGTALGTSTAIWDDTMLAELGVTDGTYEWTWGSGADADSFTLYAGKAPPATGVPEPASLALFGAALAGLGLMRRRKRA